MEPSVRTTARGLVDHAAAIWLGAIAGYGVALLANIVMFRMCHDQPCGRSIGTYFNGTPAWLAGLVAGWFAARAASRTTAVPAGTLVAITLYAMQVPLGSEHPRSAEIGTMPGDFVVTALFRPVLVIVPGVFAVALILLYVWPLAVWSSGWTTFFAWPRPTMRRLRWRHPLIAMACLFSGVLAEYLNAPSAWSLQVRRRIAAVHLAAYPSAKGEAFTGWSNQQIAYQVPGTVSTDDLLDFYGKFFNGWRTLDRTYQDALWLDPSGSVVAWAYALPSSKDAPGTTRNVNVSLRDVDRSLWQHGLRRTESGRQIADVVADLNRTRD